MYTKTVGRSVGGGTANPPSTDFDDIAVVLNVASGTSIKQGAIFGYDGTSLVTNATTPNVEAVVAGDSASSIRTAGVYQGPTFTTATAALGTPIVLRQRGYGVVLASSEGGGVNVGSIIVTNATAARAGALVGAFAYGTVIGKVAATGAVTTIGGVVIAATTTTETLVNAYISIE